MVLSLMGLAIHFGGRFSAPSVYRNHLGSLTETQVRLLGPTLRPKSQCVRMSTQELEFAFSADKGASDGGWD